MEGRDMFSIATDYKTHLGDPDPYLRRIADAGYSNAHWCHQWNTDLIYNRSEIQQIRRKIKEYGIEVNDVHGSEGCEKFWYSADESARLAGVDLVKNRLDLAAHLGGDAVVMHVYPEPNDPGDNEIFWTQLQRTLDTLEEHARMRGVRIAVENLVDFPGVRSGSVTFAEARDNWETIGKIFSRYSPDFVGLCFDSGHSNLGRDRLDGLNPFLDRLLVLHLNDNDGSSDQHHLPFSDTINWSRVVRSIDKSSYDKPLNLEIAMRNSEIEDESEFLRQGLASCERITSMIKRIRRVDPLPAGDRVRRE